LLHYSSSIDYTGMSLDEIEEFDRAFRIFGTKVLALCAAAGFLWNGFVKTREKFSLGASLVGLIVGNFIGFVLFAIFNGLLVKAGIEHMIYYFYYGFMGLGFLVTGFLLRGWYPAFKSDGYDERRPWLFDK
ncbi:MAG: hypothetical protein FWG44_07400, partial [Oscillospiraceae bacterium]|nr:hypothetical protein [Oscillospiraceae bacterium]